MLTGEYFLAALCILVWVFVGRWIYKITRKEEPEKEPEIFDSRNLKDDIHALNERMNRLAELDDMLIELNLCKPDEALRAFRMEWQNTAGAEHRIDIMADGESDSCECLKAFAIAERKQLNQEIGQRINSLYKKACYFQIVDDFSEKKYSGEWQSSEMR